MKYQQVSVDFVSMIYTAFTYLMLAGAVWIFLRLFQACFWLPRHLRKQTDIQQMLQDKVASYEKYVMECEEKEKAASENSIQNKDHLEENPDEDEEPVVIDEVKWKERRECLEMLKKELKRIQDGGELYDWDHLLEEAEKELNETDDMNKEKNTDENQVENEDEKLIDEERKDNNKLEEVDEFKSTIEKPEKATKQNLELKKNK